MTLILVNTATVYEELDEYKRVFETMRTMEFLEKYIK